MDALKKSKRHLLLTHTQLGELIADYPITSVEGYYGFMYIERKSWRVNIEASGDKQKPWLVGRVRI